MARSLRSINARNPLRSSRFRRLALAAGLGIASGIGLAPAQAQQMCGGVTYPFPYTDVASVGAAFCPGIMEAYVTGVSKGTTPTTFSPNSTVTRVQMTTFLQRSLDQGLTRSSRRAALNQWWTPQNTDAMQMIHFLAASLISCTVDGKNIWMPTMGSVVELQASTGVILGTWTGAGLSDSALVAAGKVFVTGSTSPGNLYVFDPTQPPGAVTVAASSLGNVPTGIAFDGTNIWTANFGGSVSIVTPQSPYTVTTISTGFSVLKGILYDGANIWVTDQAAGTLLKLNSAGGILQTVTVGAVPQYPAFDGANIWVPNYNSNSITVVQASTGNVVATITVDANNQLNAPYAASFDGERVLVTNYNGNSVTLFKAADLSFIANVTTGASSFPLRGCSDGINFWIPLNGAGNLARF